MIDILTRRFGEKSLYRILFAAIILFQGFYLIQTAAYFVPLGYDGVIYVWPVGKVMAEASSLKEFSIALISSFLGEDHLSPVNNLYGYFCYLLAPNHPSLILNITSKLTYLTVVILSLVVVYNLWKDKLRLLIFFLFLTFNLSMTWQNQLHPGVLSLYMIAPLLCLFLLHRFIENNGRISLLLFALGFFILTFSFETAFVGIPLLAVYALLRTWNKKIAPDEKIKGLLKIYILMFVSFLPYILIHYKLYGTPIPSSRTSLIVGNGGYLGYLMHYAKLFAFLISDWLFDIPRYIFLSTAPVVMAVLLLLGTSLAALFIYSAYKFRLLSQIGVCLFVALLFQLLCVLYTGRADPGMWTLVGLIFWMVMTDVIVTAFKKLRVKQDNRYTFNRTLLFVSVAVPFLALINQTVQPLKRAESHYRRPYQSSQAAYKAIAEGAERIVVIRLPDAEELMHPMAFWLGNRIYNGQPSLVLYPEYHQLLFKNMNIEYHNNPNYRPFSYFSQFLIPKPGDNEIVVIKNRNLYSRLFLDSNNQKITRAGVIPDSPADFFTLNFPDLSQYNRQATELEFTLTFSSTPNDLKKIFYGGEEIAKWSILDKTISFSTKNLSKENNLIIQRASKKSQLELIEVEFPSNSPSRFIENSPIPGKKISLATSENPCRYKIEGSLDIHKDFGIYGTLDAQKTISFRILNNNPRELTFQSFETNRKEQKTGKIDLSHLPEKDRPLRICDFHENNHSFSFRTQ